jgi:predicted chitinase
MGLLNLNYNFDNKENAIQSIFKECYRQDLLLFNQRAYIMATVEHESAGTFKPVREAFFRYDRSKPLSDDEKFKQAELWRKNNLRYFPFYGRGLVQITWEYNYKIYQERIKKFFNIDIDLIKNPDLAMDNDIACFILIDGFKYGIFTGFKISDFIDELGNDFYSARKCINGLDQSENIAKLADNWFLKLTA